MYIISVRPLSTSITGYAGSIEETKSLNVTCTTTGSRPRATLEWTIGQKDVTSNATEQFSHNIASDTYTVISELTYSVGKSDNGQVLTCKAVNVAASRGLHISIILNVTSELKTVKFYHRRIYRAKMGMSHDSFVIVLNHIIISPVISNYIMFLSFHIKRFDFICYVGRQK